MKLRWPRGRWNKKRITGFRLRVVVYPEHSWSLEAHWYHGCPCIIIGKLVINLEACFEGE